MDGLPQQPGWTGRLPQVEKVNKEEIFSLMQLFDSMNLGAFITGRKLVFSLFAQNC